MSNSAQSVTPPGRARSGSSDPVSRYLDDARALARTTGLPDLLQRDLVSINCRNALDSAAIRVIEATRLAAGASHTALGELLEMTKAPASCWPWPCSTIPAGATTTPAASSGDTGWAPDPLDICIRSGHGDFTGDPRTLVDRAADLVAMIRR